VTTASDSRDGSNQELPQIAQFLIAAGQAAPSADNSQPWCFSWQDGELALYYCPDDAAAKVFGADRHCERLTMGAVVENIIQAANSAGLNADWNLTPDGPQYIRAAIDPFAPVTDALRHHPVFNRHTNRLAYRSEPVPDQVLTNLSSLTEADCRLLIITDAQRIAEVAHLVELASRLRFRTREIHEWFGGVLRFSADEIATGTGLDVATIDLPPGGRLLLRLIQDWQWLSLLNRLGFYKLLAKIESVKATNAAAIVAIVGPRSAAAEFAAGRLMERAWILLNSNEIAVQPFYVVTDLLRRLEANRTPPELVNEARVLRHRLSSFLPDDNNVHMFLRAGLPMTEPIRSRRLPLEAACATSTPARTQGAS